MARDGGGLDPGWLVATLGAALPAAGVTAVGAGLLAAGQTGPGAGALAGGLALGGLALGVLMPIIDRTLGSGRKQPWEDLMPYTRHVAGLDDTAKLAAALSDAVRRNRVARGACLLVPDEEGEGVRVIGEGRDQILAIDAAFELIQQGPVTPESARAAPEGGGGPEALALLELLGANVLVPLHHRDLVVGVAAFQGLDSAIDNQGGGMAARIARATALAIANTHLQTATRSKRSLTEALALSAVVQETLMPGERAFHHGDLTVRGVFRPMAECGGDFWTWHPLGEGRVLAVAGDVTGHGAPAAMITAAVKGCIEAVLGAVGARVDPGELLSAMNRAVFQVAKTQWLMTAFAAVCDAKTGEMEFANAGQNFPYLIAPAADGGTESKLTQLVARGNALGAVAQTRFTTQRRPFLPGERLLLYTDGIIDQASPTGETFGEKRLRASLAASGGDEPPAIIDRVLGELERHCAGTPLGDDVTMVVVASEPPAVPLEEP